MPYPRDTVTRALETRRSEPASHHLYFVDGRTKQDRIVASHHGLFLEMASLVIFGDGEATRAVEH